MFTKRQIAVIYAAAFLTLAFAGATTWLELNPPAKPLEHYNTLPAFTLTNQEGGTVTLDDLKGKVWLADFVYTTCPGPCPIITAHMAQLQRKIPDSPDVRLVSFSTDPGNDTPAVLKAYAKKFGATEKWIFLTGPKDRMFDLIQHGFLLPISAPAGAQVIHSTRMLLVDRTGTVRGLYNGATSEDDARIVTDMRKLLQE